MKYLLDSNIFIESQKRFYEFDICPGFWDWIKSCNDLKSIQNVRDEILQGNDDLIPWIKENLKKDWFLKNDLLVHENYNRIADYVYGLKEYNTRQKDKFLNGADGWLIATAMKQNDTIVTLEKLHPTTKDKIYLPIIASNFKIQCIALCDLLRHFNIKFILKQNKQSGASTSSQDDVFQLTAEE